MTTKTIASPWLTREQDEAIPVVKTEYSDIFRFDVTVDGVLTIALDEALLSELEHVPDAVEVMRHGRAAVALNRHNVGVLKRFLNEIE